MNALVLLAMSLSGIAACIAIIGGWKRNPMKRPAMSGMPSCPARLVSASIRNSSPNPRHVPASPTQMNGLGVEKRETSGPTTRVTIDDPSETESICIPDLSASTPKTP